MIPVYEYPAELAPGGKPRCSVLVPLDLWSAPALVRCPFPAVGHWRGVCACGHPREGDLCGAHAAVAGDGGCRACLELEDGAHDCALPVARTGDVS